jgi:hypothetical protein
MLTAFDIQLHVYTQNTNNNVTDDIRLLARYGDPTPHEILTRPGWAPFAYDPPRPHSVDSGFLSASGNFLNIGGVGASGWATRSSSGVASVSWEQAVKNTGSSEAYIYLDYTIPSMSAWITPGDGVFREAGTSASASATFSAVHYTETDILNYNLFHYQLRFESNDFPFLATLDESPDLLEDAGGSQYYNVFNGNLIGKVYEEFSGSKPFLVLEPEELVVMTYVLRADISMTAERSAQAFVGDPFNIRSGGGEMFSVRLGDPFGSEPSSPVPEPAPAALTLAGIALLWIGRLRRNP